MASTKDHQKELDSGFTTVRRKNMRRGKPHQQIYRPGSGPLKKSNPLEESESDTNLVLNSRQNQSTWDNSRPVDDSRHKSAGSSPRDKILTRVDKTASQLDDVSFNKESMKSQKKPDQMIYVPRAVAHAKEAVNVSQDSNRNSYAHVNGNEKHSESKDNYAYGRKPYSERRRSDYGGDADNMKDKWRESKSEHGPGNRQRQGSEPRAADNASGQNWNRTRDTRSVEPYTHPSRHYNPEKIQSKPPSGRRHSMVGLEHERRFKPPMNIDHLPPRLQKKFLEQNNMPEENWDGNSLTFQGHTTFNSSKNPSCHPMGSNYNSFTSTHNFNNPQLGNLVGYHTLPNRSRGRGRLFQEQESSPGGYGYGSVTPDRVVTPTNSRPPTPPGMRKIDSRPHSPEIQEPRSYQNRYSSSIPEEKPREKDKKDHNYPRRFYGGRRQEDDWNYDRGREGIHAKRGDGMRDSGRDMFSSRNNRDPPRRDRDNSNRDNRRGGGNFRDRRERRDRNRRSKSREYNTRTPAANGGSFDCNRNDEENNKSVDAIESELCKSLESRLSLISAEETQPHSIQPYISTTLDWSEEVEMNDRLEAEILSDAPTRSSSITSLQDISTKSLPPNINTPSQAPSKKSKRRNRKNSRNRSGTRERSSSNNRQRHTRQDSTTSIDSRDGNFKVPQVPYSGRRKNSKDRRDSSYDRYRGGSGNPSRESSWDRQKSKSSEVENWREGRQSSERENRGSFERGTKGNPEREMRGNLEELKNVGPNVKKAGVLVLPPQQKSEPIAVPGSNAKDQPKYPETRRSPCQQKSLFDPNNPNRPIVVKSQSSRVSVPGFSDDLKGAAPPPLYATDQFGNPRPCWYDEASEDFKSCHYGDLLRDIRRADVELQYIISNGWLLVNWGLVEQLRQFLKEALEYLLCKTIKFCQKANVEQHFWNILYHNIIEVTRKALKSDLENKDKYKAFLLFIIDEGTKYFERLLGLLEDTYSFKLSNYLGENNVNKGQAFVGLALICAQKLFLFLGDLGRYREEVNESSNYGKCRQWYIKSQEINPKNGKPYNQLALLAVYARRKLDAVYFYMRSLMSSNPIPSARENLIALLDENRKKYEQGEKRRREERLERQRSQMKQKESEDPGNAPGSLRKETWVHPEGGRKVHRTTQASLEQQDSEEEDLASLSSVEVNKRFVISYLHVHGKLITNIGMETFQETAMQMLKEFRALLQQSPVPLPCNRFLQLLALNMFAIESTQLKDPQFQSQPGYRSELQERALVVSLQMFDLILERSISILQDHLRAHQDGADFLPPDGEVLLPAIKIWCDWMLCHTDVWNPPPSTRDFRVAGSSGDAWNRLASLMNLLGQMDRSALDSFVNDDHDGYEQIRLPEDGVLNGFTPLMYTSQETTFAPEDLDTERAHFCLRLGKLLFFGTEYLCGVEPPVLKLEIEDDFREYVSVVSSGGSRDSPPTPGELVRNNDVLLESFCSSEDETEHEAEKIVHNASSEVRDLLTRKVELEKRRRSQELHMQRVKKILSQSVVSVHMEVRPKYLVPDTNCFIDHVDGIVKIAQSHCYTLMVSIVVLSELEGLSRGGRAPTPDSRSSVDPQHMRKVASAAKDALDFLKTRHSSVKCVTTKGVIIPSTTFSTEDETTWDCNQKNDDKILTTCLVLCKGHKYQTHDNVEGEPRHLVREVVLLTEDRNLRVKAHARDVPVRELPDFMRWAGLG